MAKILKKKKKKRKADKVKEQFEKALEVKSDITLSINPDDLVPTGSTTFNLECSGYLEGAFKLGTMANIIGDSHAGKTLFCLTVFAECSTLKRFKNHRFIFDDVEAANEFNIPHLFGKPVAKRIEMGIRSKTVEDLNDNLKRSMDNNKPFIYVCDSFDGLTTESAILKDEENRKLREKGNKTKGDYGDGKAKVFSRLCSQRIQELHDHNSLLIIISQTRDNIGFGAMFTPKTRSGGRALKFYAFHEVWLACGKTKKEGKRTVKTNVMAKIKKNKLSGRHGEAVFPILFDYGVDDIVSCIEFLISEGDWSGPMTAINTKGFLALKGKKKKVKHPNLKTLIMNIEENDREPELQKLCLQTYNNVMESLKPKRKRKY